jgi:hypothetical protein
LLGLLFSYSFFSSLSTVLLRIRKATERDETEIERRNRDRRPERDEQRREKGRGRERDETERETNRKGRWGSKERERGRERRIDRRTGEQANDEQRQTETDRDRQRQTEHPLALLTSLVFPQCRCPRLLSVFAPLLQVHLRVTLVVVWD